MPTKPLLSRSTQPVPLEFAGKWVAWNSDHSQIVAYSERIPELWKIVQTKSVINPIFEKVPRADVIFVGVK